MKHILPELPFSHGALAPVMSVETLEYHHGKHHRAYVDKLNELIRGTEYENLTLEQVVQRAPHGPLFNNAAQAWNHSFFWNCLSPEEQVPEGELSRSLERRFGSLNAFREEFQNAAIGQFGSGWAWLVLRKDGELGIRATANADNPLRHGETALLTCDVWEHAYYIDYRNERARFVDRVFPRLNWKFASTNLSRASRERAA